MKAVPARLYTLGPQGTFSDKAAQRLKAHLRLLTPGADPEVVYTRTIPEVLAKSEGDSAALGVFPIENSDTGTVVFAQDALVKHKVIILLEINVPVRFSLLANAPLEAVQVVFTQPVAGDQCSYFLSEHLSGAELSFTPSNTESGRRLLEQPASQPAAAIVPVEFGAEHPGQCVREDIQNYENNTTRFLVVQAAPGPVTHDFQHHKTSLLVEPQEDRPGLLYNLLSVFNRHHINLVRLESRPAKIRPWTYVFFIDFHNNEHSAECLAELSDGQREITVLGSYDSLE